MQCALPVRAAFGTNRQVSCRQIWYSTMDKLEKLVALYGLTILLRHARTRVVNTLSDDTGSHLAWDAQLRVEEKARPIMKYAYISG